MNIKFINMLLLSLSVLMNNLQAQTNTLSAADIVFFLDLEDPEPSTTPKVAQIKSAVLLAGPELFDVLEKVISENQRNLNVVGGAFRLIDLKFSSNKSRCRNLLLNNKEYFTKDHSLLQASLISLLVKCARAEDAPFFLDVFRSSTDPRLRIKTAKILSQFGDEKNLMEMKRIYAEIKSTEMQRSTNEYKDSLTVLGMNAGTNITLSAELPQDSYLTVIASDIVNYENRIAKAKTRAPSQPQKTSEKK